MKNVQPCPVPWCTVRVAHTGHSVDLDTFQGHEVTVAVELRQLAGGAPFIRVFVVTDGQEYGEDHPHVDMSPAAAGRLGEAITGLGTPTVFDFAAALVRGLALVARGGGR